MSGENPKLIKPEMLELLDRVGCSRCRRNDTCCAKGWGCLYTDGWRPSMGGLYCANQLVPVKRS